MLPLVAPSKRKRAGSDDLNATQNLVHPEWETIDPTPDVQALFGAFDTKFFQGKLRCVQLEWSKRMYQCAGICYYRKNRMGSSITIRLSEPLLKLRQRKDLVETMLHEMIHAYLFVLNIREGNGGHGPNFQRIMVSINQTAGTNITVYHTFHDEVQMYKTHVWRCNGICRERKPFFGYVKRTCNRAPGPNDQWWAQHQQTCGGYFAKTAEPAPKSRAPRVPVKAAAQPPPGQRIDIPKWGFTKASASKTITVPPKARTTGAAPKPKPNPFLREIRPTGDGNLRHVRGMKDLNSSGSDAESPGASTRKPIQTNGNLRNVIGFKDLNGAGPSRASYPDIQDLTGGHTLGSTTSNHRAVSTPPATAVRDVWSKRFADAPKKRRITNKSATPPKSNQSVGNTTSSWHLVDDSDDDILIREVKNEVIDLSDDDDGQEATTSTMPAATPRIKPDPDARQRAIKSEIVDDGLADDDSDIVLIDDDFDDEYVADATSDAAESLADTSVIDDIFGTDTLLADFNEVNDAMPDQRSADEIISCPICAERMCREVLEDHLNGCSGIKFAVSKTGKAAAAFRRAKPSAAKSERELLAEVGYTKPEIDKALGVDGEAAEYNRRIEREMRDEQRASRASTSASSATTTTATAAATSEMEMGACPVCSARIAVALMNDHLDVCLSLAAMGGD